MKRSLSLSLCFLLASIPSAFAGNHVWSGAVDGYWNNPGNWSSGGVPVLGEASLSLNFPANAARFITTNNIGPLTAQSVTLSGDNYLLRGNSALTFVPSFGLNILCSGANNVIDCPLSLNGAVAVSVAAGEHFTIADTIGGSGSLNKLGDGTLRLAPPSASPNNFSGGTIVSSGLLDLDGDLSPAVISVPGSLTIGSTNMALAPTVRLLKANQIADNAVVGIHPNGNLLLNGYPDHIGSLTMIGGTVYTDAGTLHLNGNLTAGYTPLINGAIAGKLALNSAVRTITVSNGVFGINASIADGIGGGGGGILKSGPGVLLLGASNSFSGPVTVSEGTMLAQNSWSLGSSAQTTTVSPGATLQLIGGLALPEALNLGGKLEVLGPNSLLKGSLSVNSQGVVEVANAADTLTLSNNLSGAGTLVKTGPGAFRLTGIFANINSGPVNVREGTLRLAKPAGLSALGGPLNIGTETNAPSSALVVLEANSQVPDSAAVFVDVSGELVIGNFSETIGPLTLRGGKISANAGVLTLNSDVTALGNFKFSSVAGNLSLGGGIRKFHIESYAYLEVLAVVSDGGIEKLGSGEVWLWNNNTYSGTTTVAEGIVTLFSHSALGSTFAGTIVQPGGTIRVVGGVNVGAESLHLAGEGQFGFGALLAEGTNSWAGEVGLDADARIGTPNSQSQQTRLGISGRLIGSSHLTKTGEGRLLLQGTNANTLSGPITVQEGMLLLSKTNAIAIAGPLIIGDGESGSATETVQVWRDHQIADDALVTVDKSGKLELGASKDTIGPLTMKGGQVRTELGFGGILTLNGDVIANVTTEPAEILGLLSLGGSTRNFTVTGDGLRVFGSISGDVGGAGLAKSGPGTLHLFGASAYSGLTLVNEGILEIHQDGALGSAASGTILNGNATLRLAGGVAVPAESLTVSNLAHLVSVQTNSWGGPIHMEDFLYVEAPDAEVDRLLLGGALSGAAPQIVGPGTVVYYGTNDNSAATWLHSGTLLLSKTNASAVTAVLAVGQNNIPGNTATGTVRLLLPNQITDSCGVLVDSDDLFDLNSFSDAIGALGGSGGVALGTGTLTVGGNDADAQFSGVISGTGSGDHFVKIGSGALTLEGESTYTGRTLINAGKLYVDGSIASSAVTLNAGGTLGGRGQVGNVITTGGIVSPGNPWNYGPNAKYGRLQTGSLNLGPGTKFRCEMGGLIPGTDCDQLVVSGTLILNNALFTLVPEFKGSVSNQFTIVEVVSGGAAMGNFVALPEGTQFSPVAGSAYQITYFGGAGNNDVVLRQLSVAQPAILTGIAKSPLGPMQITGAGTPGVGYDVYASTNIISTNWLNIGSIAADGAGLLQFIDDDSLVLPMRFYRFALP